MNLKEPQFLSVTPKGRGLNSLILELKYDDDMLKEKTFLGARCGLAWPLTFEKENNLVCPGGYYIIMAQEAKRLLTGECPLLVASEFQAFTLNALFEKMFNDIGVFGCFEIFADVSPRFSHFIKALELYIRDRRDLQEVRLKSAPYAESFLHGYNMIVKWLKVIKGLTIPRDFRIHSELRELRAEDLKGEPQERFYAINALRYLLGAFETSRIPEKTTNRVVEKGLRPGSWT